MTGPTLDDHAERLGIAPQRITAEPRPACDHCAAEDLPLRPITLHDASGPWVGEVYLCPACINLVQP